MKHFQSVPDWSTQASQAMHGRLFSRGGKQGLPLYMVEEKPPPIDLKNEWLANEILSVSFGLPVDTSNGNQKSHSKKATYVWNP